MHILKRTEPHRWRGCRQLAEQRQARCAHCRGILRLGVLVAAALVGGCDQHAESASRTGGNPEAGASIIHSVGCGTCHTIPGISGAEGEVGPPLTAIGRRVYIAGMLRNTPENMVKWLMDPQAVVPGNVMPNMGLSKTQARDVAAYLEAQQ